MPSARPPLGAPVLGRFTKWGGGRHWEWVGRYLGCDEFGDWWFAPPGTRCARPGVDFVEEVGWVSLVPARGDWVSSFYPEPKHIALYVDMTTPAVWQRTAAPQESHPEWEVTMVDLDLDVVLTREGHLYVDDEDEFTDHQVTLGYPREVIDLARRSCIEVFSGIEAGSEPWRSVGFARLDAALSGGRGLWALG